MPGRKSSLPGIQNLYHFGIAVAAVLSELNFPEWKSRTRQRYREAPSRLRKYR